MTLPAVILLIFSAGLHATWNLVSKRESPSVAFMLVMVFLGSLCLLPVLFWSHGLPPAFSGLIWVYLALTGASQALYYVGLAGAYRHGDLSVTYPLARATPVLFVALLTWLLGRGAPLSGLAILGMLLVVGGCLTIPVRRFSEFRWRNYWNLACLMALLAACGTAGYSLLDSQALALLRSAAGETSGISVLPVVYSLLEGLSTSLWLALIVAIRPSERQALRKIDHSRLTQAAVAGIFMVLAYTLVLFAMTFVTNVSYVVAFRQLSIPLGAMLGVLVLKEPPYLPKLVGLIVTFVGLILVGIG